MDNTKENLVVLDSIIRTTQIYGKKTVFKNSAYAPVLKKGDIVQCEFTGIGKEINLIHFAIVWSAKADNENINIIPLTSKPKDESIEQFNIEEIHNFYTKDDNGNFVNKKSFVYLQKMMEVSRKRITTRYEQDSSGKIQTDQNTGKPKQLKINDDQLKRIQEGMRLFYLDEGICLVDLINEKIKAKYYLNVTNLDRGVLKDGYRIIDSYSIYDFEKDKKILICHINNKRYSIELQELNNTQKTKYKSSNHQALYKNGIKWDKNSAKTKIQLVEALFSRVDNKVNTAFDIFEDLFK